MEGVLVMDIDSSISYRRESLEFEDREKFQICSKNFQKQYSCIYIARLKALREHVLETAKNKWGIAFYKGYLCRRYRLHA